MDQFEYLSVLISIILGLGITQLLTGFGRWLEQRRSVRVYAPAIIWALVLLIIDVQTWWSMFGLRNWESWNFLQFALVLLQPIVLFLLAILAFPGAATEVDLRTNFFVQRRWFFGLFLVLLAVSIAKELVRSGALPDAVNLAFHGMFAVQCGIALSTERDGVHRLLAWIGLLMITVYITLLFGQLLG
jgi:hypothetical protein